jgi:hypothetical protein
MAASLRIGVDFDNTIVDYAALFYEAGTAAGFTADSPGNVKTAVREYIRANHGEATWQQMQADIYGPALQRAVPFAGFSTFLEQARKRAIPVYIVSHKTRYAAAAPDATDLHEAARAWIKNRNIVVDGVYFETTRAAKLQRIAQLGCTHFIDDLPEVLDDPAFPGNVLRMLFSPDGGEPGLTYRAYRNWSELTGEFVSTAV